MAWIESHLTLREHPKTYALMETLRIQKAQAIGHLHLLWWWCLDYAPDGRFPIDGHKKIARAAGYMGDAGKFIQAMIGAGFLEVVEGGDDGGGHRGVIRVHDWGEYALSYHASLERNQRKRDQTRTRVAAFRERKASGNAGVTQSNAATVPTIPTVPTIARVAPAKSAEGGKPYEVKTEVQEVVVAYKTSKGIKADDRAWDAGNFARAAKTAAILIREFGGKDKALAAIIGVKTWAESAGLDWTIETVMKRGADFLGGRLIRQSQAAHGPHVPRIPTATDALARIDAEAQALQVKS